MGWSGNLQLKMKSNTPVEEEREDGNPECEHHYQDDYLVHLNVWNG